MAISTSISKIMEQSNVLFGTSGARGKVSDMSDMVCYSYVVGFLQYLSEIGEFSAGSKVALAGDLRPSTPRILAACASAIEHLGGTPIFCGFIPTPALALYAFGRAIPSLMVTGSHIPDDRNGIKFYRQRAEVLKDDEAGIARQSLTLDPALFDADGALVAPAPLPAPVDATTDYIRRYVDFYGSGALRGMRIGVYQHSAVGRDILTDVINGLGAEAVPLGRSERFIPVDTEAVRPEDTELAKQWAAEYGFDAIVSTDGDSDRPLLADHLGVWMRGDVLGVLCARALEADYVVTPVSSNTVLEKCGSFPTTTRTRIGSPHVIAAMTAAEATGARRVCGYEANGGFLLGCDISSHGRPLSSLPTRDAILPIVSALAAARPGRLTDLLAGLPAVVTHSDRIKDFPVETSRKLMQSLTAGTDADRRERAQGLFGSIAGTVAAVDLTDGFRIIFDNDSIIHLRPSGNAPELRCYTEGKSAEAAASLNAAALAIVREAQP